MNEILYSTVTRMWIYYFLPVNGISLCEVPLLGIWASSWFYLEVSYVIRSLYVPFNDNEL